MLFFWRKHREKLERWKNRHKLTHQAYTSDCYLIAMKAPFPVWTPVLLSYGKVFTFFFFSFFYRPQHRGERGSLFWREGEGSSAIGSLTSDGVAKLFRSRKDANGGGK